MKKHLPVFFFGSILFSIGFFSCTKINDSTRLGGDLIPAVDNVTTFDTSLVLSTDNRGNLNADSLGFNDDVAIGYINDPEFGTTTADAYFNVNLLSYGNYPFLGKKADINVDSVVLSLSYRGVYGDSTLAQAITVYEIPQSASFSDTAFYKFNSNDIAVSNTLGTKSFRASELDDSILVKTLPDTIVRKTANVLRMLIASSIGTRLKDLDSAGLSNDTSLKRELKGFGIRSGATGNSLSYFNLTDAAKSKLIVYYRSKVNGRDTAATIEFYHSPIYPPGSSAISFSPPNFRNGQANIIKRVPASGFAANLVTTIDPVIYLQSTPGSITSISIPGLSTLGNKIIHRAELLVSKVANSTTFTPPGLLFLDHFRKDTAFTFHTDMPLDQNLTYDPFGFGGILKSNDTYSFNITRYVQGIVTRNEPNDTLRLYAPLTAVVFDKNINRRTGLPILSQVARGRVIIAGGNHPDPAKRMRLRIIYSNL